MTEPSSKTRRLPKPIRSAIVGTGYIADFHARAIRRADGVDLVAVCDANRERAKAFATSWGVDAAFDSVEAMLRSQQLDAIHILVPPDLHYGLAELALQSKLHVFVEKPMCVSLEEAEQLLDMAEDNGVVIGANHNMLYAKPYEKLREVLRSGVLGPLDHVGFNHFQELPPIRSGPFTAWMVRAPENALLEIGPHIFSGVIDLLGKPEQLSAVAEREILLPGGATAFRRWRARATVGRTALDINISLAPGFNQRTINVRGLLGTVTVDFDANTCVVDRRTPLGIDLDRYDRSRSMARQISRQARDNFADYVLSKLKLRHRGNPYEVTIQDSVAAFYAGLRKGVLDNRISGALGRDVVSECHRIAHAAGVVFTPSAPSKRPLKKSVNPTVLVVGAAGFIGRELVRQLLEVGYVVRAAVRGASSSLDELDQDRLEIVRGNLLNQDDLKAMLEGIDFVYNLANADAKTWEERVRQDVETARHLAEACLATGVKRMVYTGTIDSYYAGAKAGTITEATPLDPNIGRRNYYARAKAAAEEILLDMHRAKQLPVVIVRPGIVIGRGGNPFHWGVGMWVSQGVCLSWGDGKNFLPFVLVRDVAAALVQAIRVPGIEGRSYNLVDQPLLTARDYIREVENRTEMKVSVHYRPIWRFFMADAAKWVVKLAVRHPDRARVPSYADWESRTQRAHFDSTRARTELRWSPASDRDRLINEGVAGSLEVWLAAIK